LGGGVTGLCLGAAAGFGTSQAVGPLGDVQISYSQCGEDLVLAQLLGGLHVEKPDYIDIGAWDPVKGSNTYIFYRRGCRGVLVEPNPAMCEKLKRRQGDVVVNAGIAGADSPPIADYYIIEGDGELNTFDKDQVKNILLQRPNSVKAVVKMPLLSVNKVLEDNFKAAPALFSIDTEGMDFSILRTLDFERWRPKVFCVEAVVPSGAINEDILRLMASKDYVLRGGNQVNAMFVDKRLYV
jgi:FkbM family methyltransferase